MSDYVERIKPRSKHKFKVRASVHHSSDNTSNDRTIRMSFNGNDS